MYYSMMCSVTLYAAIKTQSICCMWYCYSLLYCKLYIAACVHEDYVYSIHMWCNDWNNEIAQLYVKSHIHSCTVYEECNKSKICLKIAVKNIHNTPQGLVSMWL